MAFSRRYTAKSWRLLRGALQVGFRASPDLPYEYVLDVHGFQFLDWSSSLRLFQARYLTTRKECRTQEYRLPHDINWRFSYVWGVYHRCLHNRSCCSTKIHAERHIWPHPPPCNKYSTILASLATPWHEKALDNLCRGPCLAPAPTFLHFLEYILKILHL